MARLILDDGSEPVVLDERTAAELEPLLRQAAQLLANAGINPAPLGALLVPFFAARKRVTRGFPSSEVAPPSSVSMVDTRGAAEALNVTERQVLNLIGAAQLDAVKVDGRWRIDAEALADLIERRTA